MRSLLSGLFCVLLCTSCMPLMSGEQDLDLSGQEVRLTLLHTSDIHSRLIPYDFAPLKTDTDLGIVPEAGPFGGATRMGAILKRERTRSSRLLHLDSGDCFQGAPIFNLNNGQAEMSFLSRMGLDAAVIGNHEFDAGLLNFVEKTRDFATFPLMAANYYWDSPSDPGNAQALLNTVPYVIRNVKGLKVGIIGMANISSLNSLVEGGNSLQATPLEQNEAARAYVEMLRPVVDLVVAVSHLGMHEDQDLIRGYEAFYEYERARPYLEREHEPWQLMEYADPSQEGNPKAVVRVFIPGVSGLDAILGGHLHVVLNPPQQLSDPSGRKVLLVHSGAFAKYVGRADLVVKVPKADERTIDGAEIVSNDYRVFPLDGLWCDDAMRAYYKDNFWNAGQFINAPGVRQAIARCQEMEDRETTDLLQPFLLGMDFNMQLTSIFSYAPRDVARRNTSTGGDSPLGNIAADSMRKRRAVEAEMALTNSLGIRDNLYAGVVSQESMFNVFPFENTINLMYLSGVEIQEMLDFVAERSAERGCVSQAQISGARFTMDCAQVQLNDLRIPCTTTDNCPSENREGHAPWQCLQDQDGSRCYARPATDVVINGKPLNPNGMYRVAVNDYIAKGGSGFSVLKRNTTRQETGISLRDSLIGYMQGFCTCDDLLDPDKPLPKTSKTGEYCGTLVNGEWKIDDQLINFCTQAKAYKTSLTEALKNQTVGTCSCEEVLPPRADAAQRCGVEGLTPEIIRSTCLGSVPQGPYTGRCYCRDALGGAQECGTVTKQLETFCKNPTEMPIANAVEDNRIGRRVK
ncbi:multifunctional 2',3'-cyclic-nucleotide 2'-phosphodiesterase/5'-nucleotidase/3'-nucleotidase [Archangium sp. Cb G35]|uniref:bifunctional metallophosphatase/5'-nucleotidase n=1 Tax=Archangium sp. Cb G35 TaxID=1920190 RepID=UPI000937278C|nr:5'-nucleotidase C-terminal domain-containing protein [Archangium sp. Cb G35]OJT20590.1 multifunctional 2',3'-cyclic-nucleotide 2'-phosphodiesterase/5'-nucleotidase/3'-nucleotidase [Archangium sp. Cb G35]